MVDTKFSYVVSIGFILMFMLVGVYDLLAIMSKGKLESVTSHIQAWSQEFPLLPFVLGAIIGHLFWPSK